MLDLQQAQPQLKPLQQPHEVQQQPIAPEAIPSQFKDHYLSVMHYQEKCFSQNFLFDKLMHKQIRISQNPSNNQLDIVSVTASKNYEIIELIVKIGPYQLKVNIINNQGPSPLHSLGWISEGSYGKIYKYTAKSGHQKAVKCIQVKKQLKFQEEIFKMIQQYALLKIASSLETAPSLNFANFDIFVYRNFKVPLKEEKTDQNQNICRACLQFEMEYCQSGKGISQQQTEQLLKSLYTLHCLGIVHSDIKFQNILFSRSLNKWVFLDFGVSTYISEKIGYSKLVSYRGTFRCCGPEMAKLYPKGVGVVDLYWNDIVGLQLSLPLLQKTRRQQMKVKVYQGVVDVQSHFLMLELKYYLYFYNFAEIQKKCMEIRWETREKRWLFYFLFEVDYLPDPLKKFLGIAIDWQALSTIQHLSPSQIFGIVTSPLAFRNQKYVQIEAIKQKSLIYFEMARFYLQELQGNNSKKYIKASYQKKQRDRILKILGDYKKASLLAKQYQQRYIYLLFQFVDFVKCKYGVSMHKKAKFCWIFESYCHQKKQNTIQSKQDDQKRNQVQQFSLSVIHFFINYLLNAFLASPEGFLKDLFPRIYVNYVMLGLAKTSTIQSVYKNILASKQELVKKCQLFYTVYINKFWYQNVIYSQSELDFLKLRNIQIQVLSQLCNRIKYTHKQTDHSCNASQLCYQVEQAMVQGIKKFCQKKVREATKIDNRMNSYTSILQLLQQNLANVKQATEKDTAQALLSKGKVVMKIQDNKKINGSFEKLKFSAWQIPINLAQLYTEELFGICSQSFCQTVLHIQDIFNCSQITQFWFITLLKNFAIQYQKSKDQQKTSAYFRQINAIYQKKQSNRTNLILYLLCLFNLRKCLYKQSVRNMSQDNFFERNIDELLNTIRLVGDMMSQSELSEYLIVLNEDRAYSIWLYLRRINDHQRERVDTILSLAADKLKSVTCKMKQKIKSFAIQVFSELLLTNFLSKTMQQREKLDEYVLAQSNNSKQIFFVKYKYLQMVSLKIHNSAENSVIQLTQLKKYFTQLTNILSQYEDEQYFLTQKIRFHLFCLYSTYLLQNTQYQQLLQLYNKVCSRIFSYISTQTYYLLHRLKISLYNYYVGNRFFIDQWSQFRDFFIKQLSKKDHYSLQILNIFFIYLQLLYQTILSICVSFKKTNRLSFQKMMQQNYKALVLFDLMNIDTKWKEIELYYRCWYLLLSFKEIEKPQKCSNLRFLRSLTKKHKRIIQIILKKEIEHALRQQLSFYAFKTKIKIFSKFQKQKYKQKKVSFIHLKMFKEKIHQYYLKQSIYKNIIFVYPSE